MRLFVALAALLTAAPAVPQALAPNSTLWSDAAPPARYRGEARVIVSFSRTVQADCIAIGALPPPKDMEIAACHKAGFVIMPLPADAADAGEQYAHLIDHELGHALGWPITHGD